MDRSVVLKSVILVLGIVVGAALPSLWEAVFADPKPPPTVPAQSENPFRDLEAERTRRRIEALEKRVEVATKQPEPSPDGSVDAMAEPTAKQDAPVPDYSPEAQAAGLAAAFRKYEQELGAFESQATDPSWAPHMTAQIQSGLARIIEGGHLHATSSVECRSSMCRARVTWPDYKTAQREYLYADSSEPGCARQLMLYEPADPGAAYTASLVVKCNREAK